MPFLPKNIVSINSLFYETLDTCNTSSPTTQYEMLLALGWQFYIVEQSRGRCYLSDKVITVPTWLWKPEAMRSKLGDTYCLQTKLNYRVWYICHEMAHAIDFMQRGHSNHDIAFMECLKKVCPPEAIGYESGYSTKAALACGIAPDDF